jgi:hypothetical protein
MRDRRWRDRPGGMRQTMFDAFELLQGDAHADTLPAARKLQKQKCRQRASVPLAGSSQLVLPAGRLTARLTFRGSIRLAVLIATRPTGILLRLSLGGRDGGRAVASARLHDGWRNVSGIARTVMSRDAGRVIGLRLHGPRCGIRCADLVLRRSNHGWRNGLARRDGALDNGRVVARRSDGGRLNRRAGRRLRRIDDRRSGTLHWLNPYAAIHVVARIDR